MLYFLEEFFDIEDYSCADSKWFPIFEAAKLVIRIIQIAVPFALVIWGSLDWFKALIAHDEKEMRIKRKPFIKRVVAALIVMVLPWIVELISSELSGKAEFWTCYTEAKPRIDFKNWDNYSEFWDDDTTMNTITITGGMSNGFDEINQNLQNAVQNGKKAIQEANPNKLHCDQYSYQTCPTVDDYGAACIPDDNNGNLKCTYNKNAKSCRDCKYTCPKLDDYEKPCIPDDKNGQSTPGCKENPNPKSCEDLSTGGVSACTTDDFGNSCFWNGSSCNPK